MKRISSLLIVLFIVCASVAHGGDVTIEVAMSTGPEDDSTTTFAVDTPKIFAYFETKGVQNGDKLRGVLGLRKTWATLRRREQRSTSRS